MIQSKPHTFKGMSRDFHPIKQDAALLWDAHNIRLTAREGNSLMSLTNEKSTVELLSFNKDEVYVGHAVISDHLILFSTNSTTDTIYRINLKKKPLRKDILYSGNLNLNPEYPLQTLADYEAKLLQKVYWVDGLNRPRVINIAKSFLKEVDENAQYYDAANNRYNYTDIYNDAPFDFIQDLNLEEEVTVDRVISGSGIFPSGTIQYAFTYYNKYGQESNIFWTTEVLYLSHADRGGSPEEVINTAFSITIDNIQKNFDYIRVYSIIRTSLDAVPTVKRVTDIDISKLEGTTATYTDNGMSGDTVDPTMLLYIGGKDIVAGCITSNDNTLFLGNIKYNRAELPSINSLKEKVQGLDVTLGTRSVIVRDYPPGTNGMELDQNTNQLSENTSTFKTGEVYRLGLQFQYKTGEWSEPMWVKDMEWEADGINPLCSVILTPDKTGPGAILPIYKTRLNSDLYNLLTSYGYKKVRPVVVLPNNKDKNVLAQGILCPTVFNYKDRIANAPYAQASWIFRPNSTSSEPRSLGVLDYKDGVTPEFRHLNPLVTGKYFSSEIQNMYIIDEDNPKEYYDLSDIHSTAENQRSKFSSLYFVDQSIVTFHSPDIELDEQLQINLDNGNYELYIVGCVPYYHNYGNIDIQMSSVVINPEAAGVVTSPVVTGWADTGKLISGLYYNDGLADAYGGDNIEGFRDYKGHICDWMVHMWHREGSLNNDIIRPEGIGSRSSILKKKIISNFMDGGGIIRLRKSNQFRLDNAEIKIFSSNEVSMVKFKDTNVSTEEIIYFGNVDTLNVSGLPYKIVKGKDDTKGNKSQLETVDDEPEELWDYTEALRWSREGVRIKYKSTPHAVVALGYNTGKSRDVLPILGGTLTKTVSSDTQDWLQDKGAIPAPRTLSMANFGNGSGSISLPGWYLWLAEIRQKVDEDKRFGGKTTEALRNNLWYPAGPAVSLGLADIQWWWGDTWCQKYYCLKTYPFTDEDTNQVIDIASFECESRVNINGRYDRNIGNTNNLYASPLNFNLVNNIYSQKNNFFNYRIYDEDYYKTVDYPNQFLWSMVKQPGAINDLWTNLHLANSWDLDGDKGVLNAMEVYNDYIYAFQDTEVSRILFNSRVQIPTSDGVPIEIANNEKVEGSVTISSNLGCQDKFSLISTPMGIYFMDNFNRNLYLLTPNGIEDLGSKLGTLYWGRENYWDTTWKYIDTENIRNGVRLSYDPKYQDVYFTPSTDNYGREALCFSEQLMQFTSFMNYEGAVLFPHSSRMYAIAQNENNTMSLWELYAPEETTYNNIFNRIRPFSFSFIENDYPNKIKVFDSIDMRADNYINSTLQGHGTNGIPTHLYSPGYPFDWIQATDEYQDTGERTLDGFNLKRKFRVWRTAIPRNKAGNGRSRMRNMWTKITLGMKNPDTSLTILHDLTVNYTI